MSALKLKKMSWMRRRFVKSAGLRELNDWIDVYERLKEDILTKTAYQLVGQKNIISIDSKTSDAVVLIEVVGMLSSGFPVMELDSRDVFVYDCPFSVFDVDFLTLKEEISSIRAKIPHRLEDATHIVLEGHHLALHFFIQKDYIQP